MDDEILKELRKACNRYEVLLPNNIIIVRQGNTIVIEITAKAIFMNLQSDSAAFDSWAIILKSWLDQVKKMVFKWEDPIYYF